VPYPEDWNREEVWRGDWSDVKLTPLWPSIEDDYRKDGGLNPVCAIGMGCIAIRRDVLEDWPKNEPYFANHYEFGKYWTDDVWFCCCARQMGHGVYVDCGLELPHLGLREVDHQVHRAYLHKRAAELKIPIPAGR
jgi:hypothetical protein